jgi:cysteine-rich repeat protein
MMLAGCQAVVNFEMPRETGEQCDDGIDNDGNGAVDCVDGGCLGAANCLGCGDGTQGLYEECDDGNLVPNDGCNEGCKIEICGDGVQNPGEQCDDGNDDQTDGCLTGCLLATCGDSFIRAGVEACDDGNTALDDGCDASCVVERCGDGVTQTGPQVFGVRFLWLATSCGIPREIEFRLDGDIVATVPTSAACTCDPGFFESFGTETSPPVNGLHSVTVDYSGADQFLAWAVVQFDDEGPTPTEIVIYEGTPGAAAARATSMCAGGFDENIPATTVSRPVPIFEECDDGNTNPNDGCDNSCRMFNP